MVQEQHVAAHAVHVRARHGENRSGGDGRVHGESPTLQHRESSLGGERVTGRHRDLGAASISSWFEVRSDSGPAAYTC